MKPYDESRRFPWPVEASLLFCVVIWGTNFVILKAALPSMPAQALNFLRMTASLVAVAAVHVWHTRREGTSVFETLRHDPKRTIAVGILGYTVYQIAFIAGLDRTLAGSAALIMSSSPIWTAVLAAILGYEKLKAAAWAGLAISLVGVTAIILSGQEVDLGADVLTGNLIMVVAAICWASYTTLNRPLLRDIPAVSLTFYGVLVSMLPLLAVSWPYLKEVAWGTITPLIWIAIIFSGAMSTGLTVVLWNDAVRQIGPSRTAVYSYLIPVIALITSVSFLGEHLAAGQVVGGVLVITGLLTVRRAGRQRPV